MDCGVTDGRIDLPSNYIGVRDARDRCWNMKSLLLFEWRMLLYSNTTTTPFARWSLNGVSGGCFPIYVLGICHIGGLVFNLFHPNIWVHLKVSLGMRISTHNIFYYWGNSDSRYSKKCPTGIVTMGRRGGDRIKWCAAYCSICNQISIQ